MFQLMHILHYHSSNVLFLEALEKALCVIWLLSWFCIISVWWWGWAVGRVRTQPHFRTACSCTWTLQCTTELKLKTAFEDCVATTFRADRWNASHTLEAGVAVDSRVPWTVVKRSCLNMTKYHILEAEGKSFSDSFVLLSEWSCTCTTSLKQRDEVAADFIIQCPFVGMNLFERFMYRILAAEVGSLGWL